MQETRDLIDFALKLDSLTDVIPLSELRSVSNLVQKWALAIRIHGDTPLLRSRDIHDDVSKMKCIMLITAFLETQN